jgi:hypothetical protein
MEEFWTFQSGMVAHHLFQAMMSMIQNTTTIFQFAVANPS